MSKLREQVIAELCAYLGNDTSTTTETADKIIALVVDATIVSHLTGDLQHWTEVKK